MPDKDSQPTATSETSEKSDEGVMSSVLTTDRVTGGLLMSLGLVFFIASRDLNFGDLSFPGPGFFPNILSVAALLIGVLLVLFGGRSPAISTLDWSQTPHALLILLAAGLAAIALQHLGFVLTMTLLIAALVGGVERRGIVIGLMYGAISSLSAHVLLAEVLNANLPQGPWGF